MSNWGPPESLNKSEYCKRMKQIQHKPKKFHNKFNKSVFHENGPKEKIKISFVLMKALE